MANSPLLQIPNLSPFGQTVFILYLQRYTLLGFFLIPHHVYGRYLDVPNVDPVHQLDGGLVSIPHHHVFILLDPLVVYVCNSDFIEGDVYLFD